MPAMIDMGSETVESVENKSSEVKAEVNSAVDSAMLQSPSQIVIESMNNLYAPTFLNPSIIIADLAENQLVGI